MNRESDPFSETLDAIAPARAAAAPEKALPESVADGRYRVRRLLGEGGQKQVYLAYDTRLDREVVISLLKIERMDAQSAARLRREAQALGRLGDHPNIVTVYDVAEEQGRPYIVTQYVEGGSVADLLKANARRPLPWDRVLALGRQICEALEYAHSRGIVHRDLKPDNVWLTQDGAVKLGDFGLAFGLHLSQITIEGALLGTVTYMAPEQALGQKATPRTDLYSLGAVLYELVTGRPPFMGDQLLGIVSQHIHTPPVAPSFHNPALPKPLENLILGLLAKAPEDRPETAAAVERALAGITVEPAGGKPAAAADTTSLARLAGGVFVGREKILARLQAGLHQAASGRGQLLLLVGEPGSGKTRTTEQLATYARMREAQVLLGRCYEGEGAPAFWPWVQIIRAYVEEKGAAELSSVMGPLAADIGQVVSVVRERLPDLPPPPMLEPDQARFRLFDSITTFLTNASRARPLVLILDDLHRADRSSLLLLEFLAREMRESRLLVIGTYRDMELPRAHPLAQTLAELARQGLSERITLGGLAETDVARFIELTAGVEPTEALLSAVHRHTEGNPFFVAEIVRLLVAEGRLESTDAGRIAIRIPESVREVVRRRLAHLSEACNRLLTIASVVGREFGLEVLAPLSDGTADEVAEVLEEAVAARVITELPRQPGLYSFAHALIRETLHEDLSATRRVRLHRRIGETLELLFGGGREPHLAELAYHFLQAAPGGDVERAIEYAVRAAERATMLLAYEEAVTQYERALEALKLQPQTDDRRRCDLLLALGEAQMRAGNTSGARESFQAAAEDARRLGAAEQLARAAVGIGSGAIGARFGMEDPVLVRLLNDALAAVSEADSGLRARLLAHLALAFYHEPDRRLPLVREAVAMARRVGDRPALLSALYSFAISLEGFEAGQERLGAATEIVQIAEQVGAREMALRGHFRRLRELLELGDLPAVDQELKTYTRLAEELRQPLYLWLGPFFRSIRALMEGRFQDSERLLEESLAIGKRAQDQNAVMFYYTQLVTMRRLQGRFDEIVETVKGLAEKFATLAGWRAVLALLYSEMDRREDARREFEILAADDFDGFPRHGAWVVGMCVLAQVCAYLDDGERAPKLYDLLLPFEGRNIAIGSAAVYYGPISRHLGLLAATMGRWKEAERHFQDAIGMCEKLSTPPFLACNQIDYAAMLLERAEAGDHDRARQLIRQAVETASRLGMQKAVDEGRKLAARL